MSKRHIKKRKLSPRQGFALIELIVSLAVMSILIAVLGLGMSHTRKPIEKQQTVLAAQIEQNRLNSHFKRYLPRAIDILQLTATEVKFTCQSPTVSTESIKTMSYRWSGDTRQLVFINEANQQTIIADNLKGFTISWKLTDAAQGTQYIRALQMDYQTQAAPTVNQQILVTLTNMPAKDGGSTTTVTNTYNFN